MPVMAPAPTTPVMPWPIIAISIFCQIRSIRPGSSPTMTPLKSSIAV